MKMRNMIAAVAAMAVSAVALVALPASAAETNITYNGPSAGSLATDNDGVSLRRNILNVWTDPSISDMDEMTAVVDHITVTFTVSGLGTDSVKTNQDGTEEPLYAWLAGQVGTNSAVWTMANAGDAKVPITGDGTYTVSMNLAEASESVQCLILQTNINFYAYGNSIEASGLSLDVTSITTDDGGAGDTTEATTEASTTEATTEATTTAANETTASTTTTNNSTTAKNDSTTAKNESTTAKSASTTAKNDTATTAAAETTTNTTTGESNGLAVVVAALTVAGGVALVTRKNK